MEMTQKGLGMTAVVALFMGMIVALQVGIELKLLVLNPTGDKSDRSGELTLLNPKVVKKKRWRLKRLRNLNLIIPKLFFLFP